jgi:hypothetical protein
MGRAPFKGGRKGGGPASCDFIQLAAAGCALKQFNEQMCKYSI